MRGWFLNISTRAKLVTVFGLNILLLIAASVMAFLALDAVHDADRNVVDLVEFRQNLNRQRVAMLTMLLAGQRLPEENRIAETVTRENDEILGRLRERTRGDAMFEQALRELEEIRQRFTVTRNFKVLPLIDERRLEEAKMVNAKEQNERYEKINAISERLSRAGAEKADRRVTQLHTWLVVLSAGSLLLAILMVILLKRLLADPLVEITGIADRIAAGDLSMDIARAERRHDEVGLLRHSFHRMSRSLKVMAGRAKQIADGDLRAEIRPRSEADMLGNAFGLMIGSLRGLMREIAEAVNVLAASTTEITTSTTQLASSAAETASAVTETTATVEEVKQTSQVSSQKSRQVADSAQKATQVAANGTQSVEGTVEGMTRIRQQMESIAESIVRLSEQTQAIGEIIATVDDLAAQSNLLAVNASIEAAKAGEHGKGFAVVAQEVKSLADQSKHATAQVRAILTEIQKATSGAVMATERGTRAVEAGVTQSQAAGDAIRQLNDSIFEATQLATQIAATSQQQYVGMDQVAMAMENIKAASTQTVASTRQAENAAKGLEDLGRKLKELVEKFKM